MIARANPPAAQLQAATGVPLRRIPEIRAPHERNCFEDAAAVAAGESEIDFAAAT